MCVCVCVCESTVYTYIGTIRVQGSNCGIAYQKGIEICPHNSNPDSDSINKIYIYMVYGISFMFYALVYIIVFI